MNNINIVVFKVHFLNRIYSFHFTKLDFKSVNPRAITQIKYAISFRQYDY